MSPRIDNKRFYSPSVSNSGSIGSILPVINSRENSLSLESRSIENSHEWKKKPNIIMPAQNLGNVAQAHLNSLLNKSPMFKVS